MKFISLLAISGVIMAASPAFSQYGRIGQGGGGRFDDGLGRLDRGSQRLELYLGEREFNSQQGEDTVPLKRLLQQEYGRIDFRNLDLKRVVVIAKSRHGRGQISLLTGSEYSLPQTIYGNPFDFNRMGAGLERYVFDARGPEPRGVWQLKLQGNIKIARIVVVVAESWDYPSPPIQPPPYNPPHRPEPKYVESARFSSQARCGDLRQTVQKLRNPGQQRAACEAAGREAGGRIYRSAQVNFSDGSSECRDLTDGQLSSICFGFMQNLY